MSPWHTFPPRNLARALASASALLLALSLTLHPRRAAAGDVVLKNGTVLTGTAAPLTQLPTGPTSATSAPTVVYPILMVSNDLAQYFVPSRQVIQAERGDEVQKLETFKIDPPSMLRTRAIGSLGGFVDVKPFDEFGRRSITLATANGNLPVIQAITQLNAETARVEGCNVFWRTGMATSSIPPDQLDAILHRAIKLKNPDERMKIVRFYVQARKFDRARAELDSIRDEFPEMADRCNEAAVSLTQAQAIQILDELKLRQGAGQYRLAYTYAKKFPDKDVSGSILKDRDAFLRSFDDRRDQAEKIIMMLGDLQAQLTDAKQAEEVAPLRLEIVDRLHPDTIGRLDAFVKLSGDPAMPATEKLALALSGWVVGSANAVTDLPQALNLWRARFLIREYLRTSRDGAAERAQILEKLQRLESIGHKTVAQMLPLLPPFLESPDIAPGTSTRILVTRPRDENPIAYSVLLPPEYSPGRSYPLIIALHHAGQPPQKELDFWHDQAQRHGYVVIAPEYLPETARSYDYSPDSHRVILESLCDARRRFNIDSDRVFLSGHGAGGDATFDVGMAHPDLFAGAIPLGGVSENVCRSIWENGRALPWYVVVGELDRGSVMHNSRDIARMLTYGFSGGFDLIYAQYLGGGADSYYAEIHRLFDWMARHRRVRYEKGQDVKYKTLRASDNTIYWLTAYDLPTGQIQNGKPITVSLKINEGNVLLVDSRAGAHVAMLSPDFVDFNKRLAVRVGARQKSNDFPKPDVAVMLDDFYRRGDRQLLYWAAVSF